MTSPLRTLSRSLSKIGRTGSTSRLLTGDKLSLDDNMEIQDNEFTWSVKMKSDETPGKKVDRLLVVGPTGLRVLVPTTNEELGKYSYTKMKEYTYNAAHKVFQFTWFPSKDMEETIFFTTGKSKEIHEMIGKFLANLLREKKGIKDPEKILSDCTYQRPPEVDKIKRGGTQRSYSSPAKKTGVQKRQKKRPAAEADNADKPAAESSSSSESSGSPVKSKRHTRKRDKTSFSNSENEGEGSDSSEQEETESPKKASVRTSGRGSVAAKDGEDGIKRSASQSGAKRQERRERREGGERKDRGERGDRADRADRADRGDDKERRERRERRREERGTGTGDERRERRKERRKVSDSSSDSESSEPESRPSRSAAQKTRTTGTPQRAISISAKNRSTRDKE